MNGPTHQFAGAIAALVMTQNDTSEKTCALHHPAAAIPIGVSTPPNQCHSKLEVSGWCCSRYSTGVSLPSESWGISSL